MEVWFVYSLILLFFLGFVLFSMLVLATAPSYGEDRVPPSTHPSSPVSTQDNLIVYGVLTALILFFVMVTIQSRKYVNNNH